jgi:imidazolonepropionase
MKKVDLLVINASQLVTCASDGKAKRGEQMRDLGIIKNGAVAVQDDKIVAVGASDEIAAQYESDTVIDARGKAVVPGFVDCHTHVVYAGSRLDEFEMRIAGKSYLEIMAAGGGIVSTVKATRAASEEDLFEQSSKRLDTMLQLGTTTAEIKTGYGLDAATEMKMLRVIELLEKEHSMRVVPTFLGAHAIPPEYKGRTQVYVETVLAMLAEANEWYQDSIFDERNIPFFNDVFTEENAFDLQQSQMVLEAGKGLGMGVKAHVDEFNDLGGVAMTIGLGAVSVDHLDVTPEVVLKQLAQSDTVGVALPIVNMNLGITHFANARYFIDSGGILALATDINPGSAPSPSMPITMSIASRYQRLLPAEALTASTINAAFAISMGDRVGSIETGKYADMLILDTGDYRDMIYQIGGNLVETVILGGEVIV